MVKKIIHDPVFLSKKSVDATEADKQVVTDLLDTLKANLDRCVGMAANMIGIHKNIIVVAVGPFQFVMINPVILETAGSQTGDEGCLSLPGKAGQVTRPNYVKARAFDENLEEYEIEGEGLLARAICHELDHLDGHMYVEKVEGEIHDVQYADPEDEEDWEEIDEEA